MLPSSLLICNHPGLAVALEGKSNPCTDNPFGSAVLAALRAVAHPSDSLSASIARGLPCASAWGLEDLDDFRKQTLQSIAECGYAKTLQTWIELAGFNESAERKSSASSATAVNGVASATAVNGVASIPASKISYADESFLQSRSEAVLAAAEKFDAANTTSEGIDAFIAAVESTEVQEAEATEAIRIMTIHQAKGPRL
jgi:ATP-dependent exoDNAse (exonuclease V) beta subunit